MTINFHSICHLVTCVKRHGPLWAYTSFPYEAYNAPLMASVHGSRACDEAACRAMIRPQIIRSRLHHCKNTNLVDYCKQLSVSTVY
jgi:hypothetical protein